MKKLISLMAFAACSACVFAQEPVLSFNGNLYFIPASMTKGGEAFMVSVKNSSEGGFTIYDGDFNVVKDFTDPTMGLPYQQRVVTMSRIYDPGTDWGGITRTVGGWVDDEWTVVEDQTNDYTTSSDISGFELYSDNNNYHSRYLYVSQTLFDDDEDFEYVRTRKTIIPIDTKYADYAAEHSTGSNPISNPSWGDQTIDSIMNAAGAEYFDWFYDENGRRLMKLYKHETYGGIFYEGLEIVTLDGTVKAYLPNITYLSSAYYFRGKCYVEGYNSNDNCDVLYLLGQEATGIRELSRSKAGTSVRRVGSNLMVDSDFDGQQTFVMSTMDGRVVRSLTAQKGSNTISLNGLARGMYNVTLYRQSRPMKTTKIIVR